MKSEEFVKKYMSKIDSRRRGRWKARVKEYMQEVLIQGEGLNK